jgi:cyclic beta-1,2-glucan synthetase
LENLVRQLAESHTITRRPRRRLSVLDRIREHEALLRDAYEYFATASEVQLALSYTAEWMLDNFHVVEQTLRQVREDMPAGYYRQLPKLDSPPLEGHPRVHAIARAIIQYSDYHLDLDRVTRFVRAYQRVTPLTMGELWALPTMLRLGILEGLARAVANVAGLQVGENQELSGAVAAPLPEALEDDAVVANCILSLRTLAAQDWKAFFESVSRVERVLRRDPADVYSLMDFDTRDRYRGVIEGLASATGRDEEDVAQEAVRLAEGAQSPHGEEKPSRTAHIL